MDTNTKYLNKNNVVCISTDILRVCLWDEILPNLVPKCTLNKLRNIKVR